MIPSSTFNTIVIWWIIAGLIIFPFTLSITVPYGRHTKKGWGPLISNRAGWIIMEAPVLILIAALVIAGSTEKSFLTWIFLSLFLIHYINRVFIYPFRTRTKGKKMPISIMLMAISFNVMNGFLNGYWFGYLSPAYPLSWLWDPRFILGILLFFAGMVINIRSDRTLMHLRHGGQTGYFIPYGGLFRYVSCPNFFGEILEWSGFALMTWCLPTFSFLLWTIINLVPRALDHHRWYKRTFTDYPKERKALIPFLL
ncbi:MAG: DUF1295 domain-containing protein [Bacteroidales bacterium]|nr:DUF1295 domain-containing protein [Lentimicrobiaceae bacterium]MDD5695618.1 DUF1295 domain-containing protein [Bacteroidales bacterium]